MWLKTEDFDYHLPQELIAQTPLEPRDSSRLLILDRGMKTVSSGIFRQIINYLEPGDVLVMNDTRVIMARLHGSKPTGGKAEVFLLRDLGEGRWEALVRPGGRLAPGSEIVLGDGMKVKVFERTAEGTRIVCFPSSGAAIIAMGKWGEVPLPPYIKEPLADPERYQTVLAQDWGSTAAPTATLHFTTELLQRVEEKGIKLALFTLHMGIASFRSIRTEFIEEHRLAPEFHRVPPELAETVNRAKAEGKKIIACGTDAVRALESVADESGRIRPGCNWTSLFITPGYRFKVVDRLITNLHLPRSSHLVLVSAFAGKDFVLRAYEHAIQDKFRFLSFGDATLIV
ncbi:MAG: S-adenosylmethionine:tRNA ribosyltransferase-isomerase [Dehalococcoidia bacterium]|nr:S-adenosylmethionine:tRNA ribosyltransferase-isomerase [Chloroflexota bacterium]